MGLQAVSATEPDGFFANLRNANRTMFSLWPNAPGRVTGGQLQKTDVAGQKPCARPPRGQALPVTVRI